MDEDMPDKRIEILQALKQEMTAVWTYLYAYVGLFEHTDPRRMKLLEKADPSFFALVQSALIECVLIRLARLMDPKESGRNNTNQNLSFRRLFCPCSDQSDLAEASADFAAVCRDWNGAKFQPLKEHRDKVQAHNDVPTIQGAPPMVSTKMTVENVRLLRELFCRLWKILAAANSILKGSALVEPQPWPLGIFSYLSAGAYLEKILANPSSLNEDFADSEFYGVGRGIMRVLD